MSAAVTRPQGLRIAEALVDGLPLAAVLLDEDLNTVHVNEKLAAWAGAEGVEATDIATYDLLSSLCDQADEVIEHATRCLDSGEAGQLPGLRARGADGPSRLELTLLPVSSERSVPGGVIAIFGDVSPQLQIEAHWRQRLARERARCDELEHRLEERNAQLTLAMERATRSARTDPLTGLPNRQAFAHLAEQALRLARRHQRGVALLLCDVDHLAQINEMRGFSAADDLIKGVAGALTARLRASDAVCHFGAGEFGLLLAETSAAGVTAAAERFRQAVEALAPGLEAFSEALAPSISVGGALHPQDGETLDQLAGVAAAALQRAKAIGRNRVEVSAEGAPRAPAAEDWQGQSKPRVLVVDADEERADAIARQLRDAYEVKVADGAERAIAHCGYTSFDVLVADHDLKTMTGLELLERCGALLPHALRVLLVCQADEYLGMLGAGGARFQHFVLREDGPAGVRAAVDDALLRLDVDLKQLSFLAQLDTPRAGSNQETVELALEQTTVDFEFQPIFLADHGQTVAFEALCRPRRADLSDPRMLFETALQLGVLWETGRLVRRRLADVIAKLPAATLVFVNLHPVELNDEELLQGEPHLREWADRIVFEVPERAMLPNPGRFSRNLAILRDHGYRVALDSMGVGYGGISSAALFAPNFVKVGRAITEGVSESPGKQTLLRNILTAAGTREIDVVCEGLETDEEVGTVKQLGARLLQGFALGRPQPVAALSLT